MIVSHQHRFIFLKTNKTAGTSIEAGLSRLCGPDDIITPYREDNEPYRQALTPQNYRIEHPLKPQRTLWRKLLGRPERYYHPSVGFYEHMPAWRVRAYLGEEVWRSYFKFAFDRNPWDRQVSWYFYKTKSKRRRPSFDRFMRDRAKAFVSNFDIYALDGEMAVDFLGRYEDLEKDLATALERIGVGKIVALPKTNVSVIRERDYRSYYSPETQALVAEWYALEIALLDYEF
jgi:Sulfotransferase family